MIADEEQRSGAVAVVDASAEPGAAVSEDAAPVDEESVVAVDAVAAGDEVEDGASDMDPVDDEVAEWNADGRALGWGLFDDRVVNDEDAPVLAGAEGLAWGVDAGPLDLTPPDPAPVDPPLVDPAPVDPTPVDEDPVDEDPVDEDPVDEDPVDEDPVDEDPVDVGSIADDPVDDVPVDDGRVGNSSVEDVAVQDLAVEAPPVDAARADDDSGDGADTLLVPAPEPIFPALPTGRPVAPRRAGGYVRRGLAALVAVGLVGLAVSAFAWIAPSPEAANRRFLDATQSRGFSVVSGEQKSLLVSAARKVCDRKDAHSTREDRRATALTSDELSAVGATFGADTRDFTSLALGTFCSR